MLIYDFKLSSKRVKSHTIDLSERLNNKEILYLNYET